MKGTIDDFKRYLSMDKSIKICILDNCSVEFLTRVQNEISYKMVFASYDIILIPQWVWNEVTDSNNRVNYITELQNALERVEIINEQDYTKLVDYKEAELYYLFQYSCDYIARLVSFMKRKITKNRPLEELEPYEEWLTTFYEQGLDGKELSNGRKQKKNAGEISIAVLSHILSFYYTELVDTITVFSNDRDAYEFISSAKRKFREDEKFKYREYISITFKSNDCLIYEWKNSGYINEGKLDAFVREYRQMRSTKFTRMKQDKSVEELDTTIDNQTFLEFLNDETVHIIF
ncbi:hypothetical protein [Natranaerobius trueperi]|uniref:Uncharacterized protein n=1 Tax=Natranaerobius trueperi TaxID=759412 RepID=A0A226BWE1_9FIRM|nr:hypothetical protein [Natranaerobius trueperi]OWZ83358.1 hypothetical protein CDO51_09060 [Natranaerobius trueperi]